MAKKKSKAVALSAELEEVVESIVKGAAKTGGSVTEDDIQVALAEIDVTDEELSDLYDAVRAKGVDITTAGGGAPTGLARAGHASHGGGGETPHRR